MKLTGEKRKLILPKLQKKPDNWFDLLSDEMSQPYFTAMLDRIEQERRSGIKIYPPANLIFNAFTLTPLNRVRIVILGQDPYHGSGQAHGLAFSVPKNVKAPPSLTNIFKELETDTGFKRANPCLKDWAIQGVFLLNTSLTVVKGQAGSHSKTLEWGRFTDAVIRGISTHKEKVVFMLWGRHAQQKENLIDSKKHLVLKAPHPSPFSAHKGFFGCKHFSQAEEFLEEKFNWV